MRKLSNSALKYKLLDQNRLTMELSNLSVLQNGLLRQDWIFRLRMGSNILHKFGSHIFSTGNRLEFETDLQFCPFMAILVVKFLREGYKIK